MLEIEGLSTAYGRVQVLWDISLKVDEGEFVAIIGANGAGKSTLLKTIAGIHKQTSGSILFETSSIENLPAHAVVSKGIALVPEGRRLFPYMTVKEKYNWNIIAQQTKRIYKTVLGEYSKSFWA